LQYIKLERHCEY